MINKIKYVLRRVDWLISKRVLKKKLIRRRLIDFDMYLDLVTPGISRPLALYRIREADKVQLIKEYVKPGMTVVDCGSNIGFYPLLEAKTMGGTGSIYAIEPDPRNFDVLLKNIEYSPYSDIIKPFHMAASNSTGKEKMLIARRSNLTKLSASDDKSFADRHSVNDTIEIDTITLDDFSSREKISINFIRMDIEGYEVEVFQGMAKILQNSSPGLRILLELHPYAYSEERSFANELEKLFNWGYVAKVLISAGSPQPDQYKKLGYSPNKTIDSDGFVRGIYEDIKTEDVISLTCGQPKATRYILLEKVK